MKTEEEVRNLLSLLETLEANGFKITKDEIAIIKFILNEGS